MADPEYGRKFVDLIRSFLYMSFTPTDPTNAKKSAAIKAAELVTNGMTFGLGTGSTVFWLIEELGKKKQEGWIIKVVPTSKASEKLAIEKGLTVLQLQDVDQLALTIDGADEIDSAGQLIKGGGGALLREKLVAAASQRLVIIADDTKLVFRLGQFPLPVEVIPFGYKQVMKKIKAAGFAESVVLRERNGEVFMTDQSNYILDCHCKSIPDVAALDQLLHAIPGVVETGLFFNMANQAILGNDKGSVQVMNFR